MVLPRISNRDGNEFVPDHVFGADWFDIVLSPNRDHIGLLAYDEQAAGGVGCNILIPIDLDAAHELAQAILSTLTDIKLGK